MIDFILVFLNFPFFVIDFLYSNPLLVVIISIAPHVIFAGFARDEEREFQVRYSNYLFAQHQ